MDLRKLPFTAANKHDISNAAPTGGKTKLIKRKASPVFFAGNSAYSEFVVSAPREPERKRAIRAEHPQKAARRAVQPLAKPGRPLAAEGSRPSRREKTASKSAKKRFMFNGKRLAIAACAVAICVAIPVVAVSMANANNNTPATARTTVIADNTGSNLFIPAGEGLVADAPTVPTPTDAAKNSANSAPIPTATANTLSGGIIEEQTEHKTTEPAETGAALLGKIDEEKETGLAPGVTSAEVAKLQERLMELHYMDEDEATEYYGPTTKACVELFQRKHGLTVDGVAGAETLKLIYSSEAKLYSVSAGAEGNDVSELQKRLVELGYLSSVTGYFGTDTETAVKAFQQKNNLTADGNVGSQTRELLYSEDAKANSLGYGTSGNDIETLQNRLQKLGYLTDKDVDGVYGNTTTLAVKRFQERNGLIADGTVGAQTKSLLFSSDAQANALMIGMSGDDVTKVQERLVKLKYMSNATGYYGSGTSSAVSKFQSRNGLSADGKVGKATMSALFSSDAKPAATTTTTPTKTTAPKKTATPTKTSKPSDDNVATDPADGNKVDQLISVAKSKLGSKYVLGAKGPNTFDCSGFVYWCINEVGVHQGYMTSATWQKCTKYPKIKTMSALQRGDIISFKGHVGIYLGGGQMIDASSSAGKIRICSNIQSSSYWKSHFVCGFRVL